MEHYFITTRHTQPKNAKARAVVEFCTRYDHVLAEGRISYDAIYAEIELFCKQINKEMTKSRPINVYRSAYNAQPLTSYEWLTIQFDGDFHNDVFQLSFTRVKSYYQFSENTTKSIAI